MAISADITARKAIEAEQKFFASIVNSTDDAVLSKSLEGIIMSWNKGAEKIFGYTASEMIGSHISRLIPSDLQNEENEIIEKIRHGHFVDHYETNRIRKDGRLIQVSLTISPIMDEDGNIIGASKISREITTVKQHEAALKASEERYRTTMDNMLEGVQIHDFEWRYIYVNDMLARYCKRPKEELIGATIMEVFPGIEQSEIFEVYDRCMKERVSETFESGFRFPDGTMRYFELKVQPVPEGIFILSIDITDRKQKEAALQASEAHYHMLVDQSADGIFVCNELGNYTDVNIAGTQMTGYSKEEILQKNIADLIVESEIARLPAELEENSNEKSISEWLFRRKDGNVFIGEISSRRMLDGRIQAVLRNITERKESELALSRSEKLYRGLFENILHGFCYCKAIFYNGELIDYKYLAVNSEYERQTGCYNITGKCISEVLPELLKSDPLYSETIAKVSLHGETLRYDTYVKPLNKWFAISVYSTEPEYFVCLVDDITVRKTAEERISQSEMHYRSLFEQASDIIYITDPEINFLDINPAGCAMLGYTKEEFLQLKPIDLLFEEDLKDNPLKINELQSGVTVRNERRLKRKDGTALETESNGKRLESGNYMIFARDIGERKKAEVLLKQNLVDLERSNQELEQFAYIASHDLQEPLRMVGSYMQLLQKRYKGKLDADADEFIHFAVDGANRMKQLITDLLNYSKINNSVIFASVNLNELMKEVLANLASGTNENNATITSDPLPVIKADKTQMLQLFQNLISNSLKFKRDKVEPVIHISAQLLGGEWLFSIKDNGIGIETQYSEKIFVIFKQLHSKAEFKGTGIGLAVAKKIVERHKGRIWYESVLGKGTTFYFTINVLL